MLIQVLLMGVLTVSWKLVSFQWLPEQADLAVLGQVIFQRQNTTSLSWKGDHYQLQLLLLSWAPGDLHFMWRWEVLEYSWDVSFYPTVRLKDFSSKVKCIIWHKSFVFYRTCFYTVIADMGCQNSRMLMVLHCQRQRYWNFIWAYDSSKVNDVAFLMGTTFYFVHP